MIWHIKDVMAKFNNDWLRKRSNAWSIWYFIHKHYDKAIAWNCITFKIGIWRGNCNWHNERMFRKIWTIVPQGRNSQPWFDQVILKWSKYWVGLQFHEIEWELWRLPENLECGGHFLSGSFESNIVMFDIIRIVT